MLKKTTKKTTTVKKTKKPIINRSEARINSAKSVFLHQSYALQQMALELEKKTFGKSFIDTLHLIDKTLKNHGRVIISGMGKSGHVGKKIAATLSSMGTVSFFVHPSEAAHGDLGMITKRDMAIIISNSGESKEVFAVMDYCKKFKIPYVALTRDGSSTLAKNANVKLTMPNIPESCPIGKAPTTSTTMTIALGDALGVVMAERNGLSGDKYKHWHPGGKLGNSLATVKNVYNSKYPIVSMKETDTVQKLVEKTAKVKGEFKVIVFDKKGAVKGQVSHYEMFKILQDSKNLKKTISSFVTDACSVDLKAGILETMEELNKHNSDYAFVLKSKKPVGLVSVSDLVANKK